MCSRGNFIPYLFIGSRLALPHFPSPWEKPILLFIVAFGYSHDAFPFLSQRGKRSRIFSLSAEPPPFKEVSAAPVSSLCFSISSRCGCMQRDRPLEIITTWFSLSLLALRIAFPKGSFLLFLKISRVAEAIPQRTIPLKFAIHRMIDTCSGILYAVENASGLEAA